MQDASLFYVNFSKDQERLNEIKQKLADYDSDTYEPLVHPIKVGTVCAAKFNVDGNWYRGRVEKSLHTEEGKHLYEVYFMDYGNTNDIAGSDLKKITNELVTYPPMAYKCTLAYLNTPKSEQAFGTDAAATFKEMLWGKTVTIRIYDEDDVRFHVAINPGTELKVNETINAYLLSEGLASLYEADSLPDELADWKEYEQDARDEQLNIWEIGGAGLEDEEF